MSHNYGSVTDNVFFFIAFLIMALVAIKPDSFIRGITLGRSGSRDVSQPILRVTRVIAGIAAVSIAISLIVNFMGIEPMFQP
ncbi:hypothetical protein ACCC88_09800 [Sphingomonas sp. Sphisp140]|uniref:hypothetical protein n=1 Tax=unclassified Sphingomonas TaxID=196159 RepID=UPI0039AEB828